jgi:AraC-like DNA-binding protein
LGEDVTVAAWSAACGLNADYFSRLFKTHTGLAPKAWLLETRLQQASRLLDFGDKSVAEVAADCGFNCPFHFSRTFKRRFGIPPAGYRQLRHIRGFQAPETVGD